MTIRPPSRKTGTAVGRFKVAHELPGRVRYTSNLLFDPGFDADYFQALLESLSGVTSARVNARGGSLVIEYDNGPATRLLIEERLANIPEETYLHGRTREHPATLSDVALKALLTVLAIPLPPPARMLAGAAVGLPTILKGLESLLTRGVKVEALDATAVGLSLARGQYFTAGAIATMLALGEYLETESEQRSTELLKSLLRPKAEKIWVNRDGQEIEIPAGEVHVGDVAVFGAGELIAVDGRVAEGEALVNQSSVTGESAPVHVRPGDPVISGSVVQEGRLLVDVTEVGAETSMARISRFIEHSLRGRSRSQTQGAELADKLAPITFALGLGMYAVTGSANRAASVLTVDFSCAVKLASPVAVRSGMYAAGKEGALLKGSSALDALAAVDTLVFDKTGTLTTGELAVTDIIPAGGLSPEELLRLAAGAEEHYDHPVARAVVREAKARGLGGPPISRVDFIVAHGVSAMIEGQNVLVGSHHFIGEDEGVPCQAMDETAHGLRRDGKSLLYVARQGRLEGILALSDAPRPEARAILARLKADGIGRVVVLTGDHHETAAALGLSIPEIDEIHGELKPEDKAAIVAELKASGRKLAYVGDGVNDAPALLSADVGVCMPKGADLARESAQVLLLSENLATLVVAREAALRTTAVIRRSFMATIGLNSLIMLLAGAGLPPVASAMLHNLTTVGILGYAARAASRPLLPAGALGARTTPSEASS